jgi:uncharacterized protein
MISDVFATLLTADIFLFLVIGLLAGACSGLLGIGGGSILVPIFLYALPHYLPATFLKTYLHHTAVATSIACIFLTALVSGVSHLIKKFTPERSVYFLALGSLLGAYFNTRYLFINISGQLIHVLFIIFLWLNIYFLFKNNVPTRQTLRSVKYNLVLYFLAGCVISTVASTIGLGGGFMVVPLLLHLGVGMHIAIACSIMNGIALAVGSLIAYYQLSFLNIHLIDKVDVSGLFGFIYMPALLIIGPIACVTAFFSTRLVYQIPQLLLKRLFACFLLLISILLLVK